MTFREVLVLVLRMVFKGEGVFDLLIPRQALDFTWLEFQSTDGQVVRVLYMLRATFGRIDKYKLYSRLGPQARRPRHVNLFETYFKTNLIKDGKKGENK